MGFDNTFPEPVSTCGHICPLQASYANIKNIPRCFFGVLIEIIHVFIKGRDFTPALFIFLLLTKFK
jgi:hypothetical protein